MDQIRAILIDDEESARSVLANLLNRSDFNINIVATSSNLEEGVEQIKKLQPNVVFLDVQMPNYAGYEIAKFFDTIAFEIIFVTAYDHHAIKAFELNAIDYLVKPIDRLKLTAAINKLITKLNQQKILINYQALLKTIKNKEYKKIVLPELGNRRIVNLDTIIAIKADGAYSVLYLKDNKTITTSKSLKYFEDLIPKETTFFRSHRTWIINLAHIESFNKATYSIILANGTITAKISRTRINDFENSI